METSLGIEENVEAALSYVLGWITGIIFLVLEKKSEFVRFHAMQSTITFLGYTIILIILDVLAFIPFIGLVFVFLGWLVWILAIITAIICILKALKGEKYKLPIVGDLAEKYLAKYTSSVQSA